jgi:hypothetical protein
VDVTVEVDVGVSEDELEGVSDGVAEDDSDGVGVGVVAGAT